jgi:transposase
VLKLSDEQWERIREHFPEEHIPAERPGRKPIPARKVLEAVLWILNTGAQWHCCRNAVRTTKPSTGVFNTGAETKYCALR